ncbi:DUF190 domain-containing protein [Sphingomonas aurantiaca]|uniref:DUF190 domain-containing protein n=1 Tax=Sphingomonas aurantiaca TaxID=185949 RepID=UPI002FE3C420
MKLADKAVKPGTRSRWAAKPLDRTLVAQAKADGIMNAVAHYTHYGYSNHGPVHENGAEIADPHLTMCVELIGQREQTRRLLPGAWRPACEQGHRLQAPGALDGQPGGLAPGRCGYGRVWLAEAWGHT